MNIGLVTKAFLTLYNIFVVILQNILDVSLCPNKTDDFSFIYLFWRRHEFLLNGEAESLYKKRAGMQVLLLAFCNE